MYLCTGVAITQVLFQHRRHAFILPSVNTSFCQSILPLQRQALFWLLSFLVLLFLGIHLMKSECVNFSVWLRLLNIMYMRFNVYSTMSIKCFILLLTTDIPWTPVVCAGLCNNSLEQRLQLIVCSFWCPAWVAFSIQGNIEPDPRNAFYHHSRRLAEARQIAGRMVPGSEGKLPFNYASRKTVFQHFSLRNHLKGLFKNSLWWGKKKKCLWGAHRSVQHDLFWRFSFFSWISGSISIHSAIHTLVLRSCNSKLIRSWARWGAPRGCVSFTVTIRNGLIPENVPSESPSQFMNQNSILSKKNEVVLKIG